MKIKALKLQIEETEQRLCFHRNDYAKRHVLYKHYREKLKYAWLVLPLGGFIVGFRRDLLVITSAVAFVRLHAFNWVQQVIQSKLMLALFS